MKDAQPLSLNFHQTFLPARNLIAKLLKFVVEHGSGSKEAISSATGIPTGAGSGKVEPMIHYALAMGLIGAKKSGGSWQLTLTSIGQIVYEEDPYLNETITMWLLHLMMCRRVGDGETARGLMDAWFTLFAGRGVRLGQIFSLTDYISVLSERHKLASTAKHARLVVNTYAEANALSQVGVLTDNGNGYYQFQPAPKDRNFYPLYSAYLLILWDEWYPNQQQIHLNELFDHTKLLPLLNWTTADIAPWLDWMSDHRIIQLDRQTGDALALRLQTSQQVIEDIYSLLL